MVFSVKKRYLCRMKHKVFYAGLLLLAAFSCTRSKEKQLIQKWNVYHVEFIKTDTGKMGSDPVAAGFEDAMREVMGSMLTNTLYDLHEDGVAQITYNGKTSNATWELKNAGKELIIVNTSAMKKTSKEEYNPKPSIIEHLDDTSMVLMMKSDQSSYQIRLRLSVVKPH